MSSELPTIPAPTPPQTAVAFWTCIALAILFIMLYAIYATTKNH